MRYPEEAEVQEEVEESRLPIPGDADVLRAGDPMIVGLGIMSMVMPVALAFQIAMELKINLLDRYELVPGIPTPEKPEPEPHWRLRVEEEAE